jgi:hypothetical protein
MRRNILLVVILLCAIAIGALAADVSGQWVAQVPGRDGGMMDTSFNFKVSGEQLTGSMENQFGERQISDGKVSGNDVSFNVHIEFGGNEMTLVFTGKVSGDEIKFKRERKGGEGGPANVEFVAKRKK